MKKYLILVLILFLMICFSTSVFAENIGIGYGFFESEEGFDVDGLILESDSNFGEEYKFTSRYFMGDGDGNYENNLLDLNLYKKMGGENNTNFYLGAGWKWLIEDDYEGDIDISNSAWGLPLSAKMEHKFNETLTFGGKIDYWFLGSYDIDITNTTTEDTANLSDDFSGFGVDLYLTSQIANNFSIKVGYVNEDHTYDSNSSNIDSGFDGFYVSGQVNY
ncbi:MAG: hypothetical protein ACOCV1_06975 [Bacillota bacterium]